MLDVLLTDTLEQRKLNTIAFKFRCLPSLIVPLEVQWRDVTYTSLGFTLLRIHPEFSKVLCILDRSRLRYSVFPFPQEFCLANFYLLGLFNCIFPPISLQT